MGIKSKAKAWLRSVLSDTLNDELFDWSARPRAFVMNTRQNGSTPVLDTANPAVIDHALVRGLYRNTLNQYALAGQLVKPIIDSNVSFIGVPTLRSTNAKTMQAIDGFKSTLPWQSVHRIAEREGTAYVWPQVQPNGELKLVVLRPEIVKTICIDPLTKEVSAYILEDRFTYKDTLDTTKNITITTVIDAKQMKQTIVADDSRLNVKDRVIRNVFGFIPIVAFVNDAEPWESRGHSEIENIEPQLKLYNDISVEAVRSQKRDGHPKMKVTTSNVRKWVERNYGVGMYELLLAGQAKLSLDDRDLYICESSGIDGEGDEDVQYVEASRTTGEFNSLSEKSFTNIVEGAQTPEIIFGANMGTSLASVREQRPAYIKKIEKKQLQYEASWRKVINVALQVKGVASFEEYDFDDFNMVWPTPDFSSEKEKADTVNVMSTSLVKMKSANMMGDKAIHNTLKQLGILQVQQDYKEYAKDVEETAKLMKERNPDKIAEQDNKMNQRVADGEYDNTVPNKDKSEEDDAK